MNKNLASLLSVLILVVSFSIGVSSQTSAFTYQGKLTNAGAGANGPYDFTFKLFPTFTGGTQVGVDAVRDDVQVTGGIFTVTLDFGSLPFTSVTGNYLEISVRPGAQTGGYQQLLPRSPITSSPYAVQTLNATQLNGLPASQYVQTGDGRLTDARAPTANSPNYIQNTTTQQATSNFNISGTGKAGIFDAVTQYNIGGNRILSAPGTDDTFVGFNSGSSTAGVYNSFFGSNAGYQTTSNVNSFFGYRAGYGNLDGCSNAFFGASAGQSNQSGCANTIIGTSADVGSGNLQFATAIGYGAVVTQSNSLVLGSINTVIDPSLHNINVGIGTTAPAYKLHVVGENIRVEGNTTSIWPRFSMNSTGGGVDQKRWQNYAGPSFMNFTAMNDAENAETVWLQVNRGSGTAINNVVFPNGSVGIGTTAPEQTLHVNGLEILSTGASAGFKFRDRGSTSSADDWVWFSSGNLARLWRAGAGDLVTVQTNGNVGIGTSAPNAKLEVNGYTKLGSDAPSIRVKTLTGTTAATEGGTVDISHGLDDSKILSVSVRVSYNPGYWTGPSYQRVNGYNFNWLQGGGFIEISNVFGASASILSKPIKIFIIYEQ